MTSDQAPEREISRDELKRAAVSGLRWTTAARVGIEAVTFVAAVILARLIPPSGFGQAVVPLILVPLATILTFEGFGSALVQRRTVEKAHVEAAMLAASAVGAVLTAITLLLAHPVGDAVLGHSQAELLIAVSPVFVLAGISAVSRGLLWRRLDFRLVALIEMAALALGSLVGVTLAISGLDAEAIVLGAVAGAAASSVLLLLAAPPPFPRLRRQALREVTAFGLPASAAGLTSVAITNSTLAVAAVRLTTTQAGLFWRAFQLGVVYQEKISGIMIRLAFPVYSRTSDLDELRAFHERATRIHAAVLLPLLALLIVVAPELVPFVFGPHWAPAVPAVQILSVAGMIAAVLTGYPQIMLAAGRPRVLLAFNVALLTLYLVVSWFAAPYGTVTLSFAVVGVHCVLLVAVYAGLFKRVLGIPVRRLVTDLFPAVCGSVGLVAVALPLAALLRGEGAPTLVILAAVGINGLLAYAVILCAFFGEIWNELFSLARRLIPERFHLRRAGPQPQMEA